MTAVSTFEQHRPRLMRIAHRMLGSVSDAEDLVQDAYLRWQEVAEQAIRSDEGYLITVVTRLALDRLRRNKVERAAYVGTWLPEPWLSDATRSATAGVENRADLRYALLVLLERLSPEERAVFLLREVFDMEYEQVADIVQKSEAACRKLFSRAQQHLSEDKARRVAEPQEELELISQFARATQAQDQDALSRMLSEQARYCTDGGGKVFAARYPIVGLPRVVDTLCRLAKKAANRWSERPVTLHGEPALVTYREGALYSVTFFDIADGRIRNIYKVLNPDKLARLKLEEMPAQDGDAGGVHAQPPQ